MNKIDEAREFLLQCDFKDNTFGEYIKTKLAGDFAVEIVSILDRCADVNEKQAEELEALRRENADLKFRLQDWHDSAETAWKSPCDDEQHCSCVPLLRKTLDEKELEIADLKLKLNGPPLGDGSGEIERLTEENADLKARVEEHNNLHHQIAQRLISHCSDTKNTQDQINEIRDFSRDIRYRPTLGASTRLRYEHYRECADKYLPALQACSEYFELSGAGSGIKMIVDEAIARAREGK